MKIRTIEIRNWRSIKELKISAQDLMIIIGQNNQVNLIYFLLFYSFLVKLSIKI
nr:AAA family ATPase [Glaesserella australis]